MKGKFETVVRKMAILKIFKILTVFVVIIVGIAGHLKSAEAKTEGGIWTRQSRFRTLTESEAEEVRAIWRVIGDQEIVTWDGKEWMAKTEDQKREAIKEVCEAWEKSGYQKIESIKYFIEDVDKYYNHYKQKGTKEGLKEKVGLVVCLSAFFYEIETSVLNH